jgi:hypothetical protein
LHPRKIGKCDGRPAIAALEPSPLCAADMH